jgi:hypothetical protein
MDSEVTKTRKWLEASFDLDELDPSLVYELCWKMTVAHTTSSADLGEIALCLREEDGNWYAVLDMVDMGSSGLPDVKAEYLRFVQKYGPDWYKDVRLVY